VGFASALQALTAVERPRDQITLLLRGEKVALRIELVGLGACQFWT